MKKVLLAMPLLCVLAAQVRAEDVNPPPWRDPLNPRTTHQRWEFNQPPTSTPFIPLDSHNPFGMAQIIPTNAQWPATAPGWIRDGQGNYPPINTLHIGDYQEPSDPIGGFIDIVVPNTPDGVKKTMIIQITSDKSHTGPPVVMSPTGPGYTSSSVPYGSIAGLGGTWYVYSDQITIEPNPPFEVIRYYFPDSTDIAEIVVDTKCDPVPEPATFVLLAMGGLVVGGGALVRRSRR
jgi:hypothetical protein